MRRKKRRKTFAWRHRSLQHLLPLTHLWRICATSLHRLLCKLSSTLSHTFSNRAVFACGSAVTFEIWSDASIIARCASHQFVQKVRGRGRLDCPAGELQLLTLHRPTGWWGSDDSGFTDINMNFLIWIKKLKFKFGHYMHFVIKGVVLWIKL